MYKCALRDFAPLTGKPTLWNHSLQINQTCVLMNKRKTPEQQLEELRLKEAQIKARIQKKQAQVRGVERKKETRRKIIAGALALEHADHDKAFGAALNRLIQEHVKRPEDRKLFGL